MVEHTMKAEITSKSTDKLNITWSDDTLGYGNLSMIWDVDTHRYVLDAEFLSVDTILKIFKALYQDE